MFGTASSNGLMINLNSIYRAVGIFGAIAAALGHCTVVGHGYSTCMALLLNRISCLVLGLAS